MTSVSCLAPNTQCKLLLTPYKKGENINNCCSQVSDIRYGYLPQKEKFHIIVTNDVCKISTQKNLSLKMMPACN